MVAGLSLFVKGWCRLVVDNVGELDPSGDGGNLCKLWEVKQL